MSIKDDKTVYINNLSYRRDEKDIKELFMKFGKVVNVKLIVDHVTNKSKGMAFVEMDSELSAEKAIAGLHGKEIDGRTVKVTHATPMKNPEKKFYPGKEKQEGIKAPKKAPAPKRELKKTTEQTRKVKKMSGLEKMLENVGKVKKRKQ